MFTKMSRTLIDEPNYASIYRLRLSSLHPYLHPDYDTTVTLVQINNLQAPI